MPASYLLTVLTFLPLAGGGRFQLLHYLLEHRADRDFLGAEVFALAAFLAMGSPLFGGQDVMVDESGLFARVIDEDVVPAFTPIRMGTLLSRAILATFATRSRRPMLPGLSRRPSTPWSKASRARR